MKKTLQATLNTTDEDLPVSQTAKDLPRWNKLLQNFEVTNRTFQVTLVFLCCREYGRKPEKQSTSRPETFVNLLKDYDSNFW